MQESMRMQTTDELWQIQTKAWGMFSLPCRVILCHSAAFNHSGKHTQTEQVINKEEQKQTPDHCFSSSPLLLPLLSKPERMNATSWWKRSETSQGSECRKQRWSGVRWFQGTPRPVFWLAFCHWSQPGARKDRTLQSVDLGNRQKCRERERQTCTPSTWSSTDSNTCNS